MMKALFTSFEVANGNSCDKAGKSYAVCVEGLYVINNKTLLFKRDVEPFKGFWHVVGGEVKENESLEEALKREFLEETALQVELGRIVCGRIEETIDRIKLIITFEVISCEGIIRLNSENAGYRWFSKFPQNSVYDYSSHMRRIKQNSIQALIE